MSAKILKRSALSPVAAPEAGPPEAGPPEAGPRDAGPRKAGPRDAGPREPEPPHTKVVDREVLLAHDEGRRIVERAEGRAGEILERAEAEAEDLRRRAVEAGRAEGLGEWQSALTELAEAREQLVRETEPRIVELAVRLAEKILRQRLEADPASLLPMVREALQVLRGGHGGDLLVRVHPGKAQALEGSKLKLLARDPRWRRLDVVADESMDPCGCRIESELGVIDVGIDTQLAALERALLPGGER